MVERRLRGRGIDDERVLAAMGAVPREEFVPEGMRRRAYEDSALPIAVGQTISQPWIVAAICQALELEGSETVLEVGTGSGYSACVLSLLAAEVVSVERHESLAAGAREALALLGVANVEVIVADGSRGLPGRGPFDAIAVHATAPAVPRTLLSQLRDGGRLVVPIAATGADMLTVFRRRGEEFEATEIGPCRFVPLVGEEGFWPTEEADGPKSRLRVDFSGPSAVRIRSHPHAGRTLRSQLLLGDLRRPAQARSQDGDDPPRR